MRLIKTSDIFKIARIITDAGIKDELKSMYAETERTNAQSLGFDFIFRLIGAVSEPKMERKIYELMADICEKTVDEFENQSLDTTINDLEEIYNNNDLRALVKRLAKLIK